MGNAGTVVSYARPPLAAGEAIQFRPGRATGFGGYGRRECFRFDPITGLLIGGAVLLIVAGGAVFTVRNWRETADEASAGNTEQVNGLLFALVNLDEAYEAGKLEESAYEQRRAALISELASIWEPVEG